VQQRELDKSNRELEIQGGHAAEGAILLRWLHCLDEKFYHPMCLRHEDGAFIYDYQCQCGVNIRHEDHVEGCSKTLLPVNRIQWRNVVSQWLGKTTSTTRPIWVGLYNGDGSRVENQYVLARWLAPMPDGFAQPGAHSEFYAKGCWEPVSSASYPVATPPGEIPAMATTRYVISTILADERRRLQRHGEDSAVMETMRELHKDTTMRRIIQEKIKEGSSVMGGLPGKRGNEVSWPVRAMAGTVLQSTTLEEKS